MIKYGEAAKLGDTVINVVTEGSGEYTIVFMAGSGVGCPGLEYKPIYRRMSDEYRIAVVEKAGYGLDGGKPRAGEQGSVERTWYSAAVHSCTALILGI